MFFVNIGAPRSHRDRKKLGKILHPHGKRTISRHSDRIFYFHDFSVRSLGTLEIHLAAPEDNHDMPFLHNFLNVDMSGLLGLYILDGYSLMPDNVTNFLWHCTVLLQESLEVFENRKMPVHSVDSLLYTELEFAIHDVFHVPQLQKFHTKFCNTSTVKQYILLKKV